MLKRIFYAVRSCSLGLFFGGHLSGSPVQDEATHQEYWGRSHLWRPLVWTKATYWEWQASWVERVSRGTLGLGKQCWNGGCHEWCLLCPVPMREKIAFTSSFVPRKSSNRFLPIWHSLEISKCIFITYDPGTFWTAARELGLWVSEFVPQPFTRGIWVSYISSPINKPCWFSEPDGTGLLFLVQVPKLRIPVQGFNLLICKGKSLLLHYPSWLWVTDSGYGSCLNSMYATTTCLHVAFYLYL